MKLTVRYIFLLVLMPFILSAQDLRIMCLAAHPDDEDGATLAYYSKIRGASAFTLFYTRGEGGQNEISSALYGELGLLRTEETYRSAKIQGSSAYFLNFPDFGFSKTARETFAQWGGKDSVLARVVYCIRALKPDVIITNHDTLTLAPRRQHGNHQAVGITAFEAFERAADRTYHPEQLRGRVGIWQVKKLYFRHLGAFPTDTNALVRTNKSVKTSDNQTIEDLAFTALAEHKTQGMDKINRSAIPPVFKNHAYVLIRSDKTYPYVADDLFSGIEKTAHSVETLAQFPYNPPLAPKAGSPEIELIMPTARIGIIQTYDNTLGDVLSRYRVPHNFLDSAAIASADLSQYHTILLDIRGYFYRPDALRHNQRLLEYVQAGGNLVVFYHKSSDWNGKNLAPYPIEISAERVTEEDAPVSVLLPNHPLFSPNALVADDWNNWVQERNMYLPHNEKTDTAYARLLAMSDEGEKQPPTSLLHARYGQGTYTYCSLALYRQLKILNRGAVKLFFNMLSQNAK